MEGLNVKSIELEKSSFHQDILDIETALREFNIQSITNPNETPLYNFELEERRAEKSFQPILSQKDFRAQLAIDVKRCFLGNIEIRPPYHEEYKTVSMAKQSVKITEIYLLDKKIRENIICFKKRCFHETFAEK